MPLTRPIPEVATAIVEELRAKVARPADLPNCYTSRLRWTRGLLNYCPLGLLPNATHPTPKWAAEIRMAVSDDIVAEFYSWWDGQVDAKAAVDAIWPPA